MKTKQGREVSYSDILLYNVNMKDIIVIVNDEEQMKKFSVTGKHEDAPIAIIPYTDSELTNIISSMKQIASYQVTSDNNINVNYTDGTKVPFDSSNEEIIRGNLSAQRKASQEKALGAWYNVSDAEKEKKKKETSKKVTKGLAGVLAAAAIAGGLYTGGKLIGKKQTKGEEEANTTPTTSASQVQEFINEADPRKTEEVEIVATDFTKEADALYQSTVDVNPFILKYQQVANVTWNKELALEVVEMLNGLYPTSMTFMSEENANAENTELQEAINLIIAGNLYPENKEEEMIDLSQYIVNEKERVLVHNAMTIARACIQESIGEPMNGKIIEDDSEINKFSRQYTNSVDQLINYEFDTINDPDYLVSSAGVRFVVASIFQNINNTIPQWSHVTRESSETDTRTYDLYCRYFFDDVKKVTYLPEPGPNGTNVYYAYWSDEISDCHKEGPYTEDVMHAMAGKPLETDETPEMLGVEVNPNIHQLGVQTEVDNKVEEAREELFRLTKKSVNTK